MQKAAQRIFHKLCKTSARFANRFGGHFRKHIGKSSFPPPPTHTHPNWRGLRRFRSAQTCGLWNVGQRGDSVPPLQAAAATPEGGSLSTTYSAETSTRSRLTGTLGDGIERGEDKKRDRLARPGQAKARSQDNPQHIYILVIMTGPSFQGPKQHTSHSLSHS